MGLEPGSHGSYGKSLGMNLMSNPGNGGAASAFNQDEGDPTPYFDTSAYVTSSEPRMGTQAPRPRPRRALPSHTL